MMESSGSDSRHVSGFKRPRRGSKKDTCQSSHNCATIQELTDLLRTHLEADSQGLIPTETRRQYVFPESGSEFSSNETSMEPYIPEADAIINVTQALCRGFDRTEKMKRQRMFARKVLDQITQVDHYKYSERQASISTHREGARFLYVCLDSLQNRDRVANGLKGRKKIAAGEDQAEPSRGRAGPQLPTFDCGGAINIKFQVKLANIVVVYRHNPIHRGSNAIEQTITPIFKPIQTSGQTLGLEYPHTASAQSTATGSWDPYGYSGDETQKDQNHTMQLDHKVRSNGESNSTPAQKAKTVKKRPSSGSEAGTPKRRRMLGMAAVKHATNENATVRDQTAKPAPDEMMPAYIYLGPKM